MIRPKLYCIPDTRNWGDIFTPFLLKNGFDIAVDELAIENNPEIKPEWLGAWRKDKDIENWSKADVFSCGSLIERIPNGFAGHVLGSGMGSTDTYRDLTKVQAPFLLRGLHTAARCACERTPRFGDPGILAHLFAPSHPCIYRYGIVPHYVDKQHEEVSYWVKQNGALLIDIEAGIREVIEAISSCEKIVSSSLHGLVIADSLDVPSAWIKLSDSVIGEGFKFRDYYSVYGEAAKPWGHIEDAFKHCRTRSTTAVKKDVQDVFMEYAKTLSHDLEL